MIELPDALREVARTLECGGHDAWIVGETLHDLLNGTKPPGFAMVTSASAAEIARRFAAAVPVRAGEVCFTLPTPAGPVDLSTLRNGVCIEDDLAHRDFTVFALAYSPTQQRLVDPHEGIRDMRTRVLRAVNDAGERLAEDPLRALRAARMIACGGYAPDADLERAMGELSATAVTAVPAVALRRELARMLVGSRAGAGLALLRRSGIEAVLAAGTKADAAALIDALPPVLAPRLAAWLRGARAGRALRRLRFGRELANHVLLLLQHHPLERGIRSRSHASLRRLLARLDDDNRQTLFELREREIELAAARGDLSAREAADSRAALKNLEQALARCSEQLDSDRREVPLALDGREVMAVLGTGPGPQIGGALRFLREQVALAPARNTPSELRALLREWAARAP